MVRDQIQKRGIENKKVLESLRSVKRHLFVPANVGRELMLTTHFPLGMAKQFLNLTLSL